MLYRKLSSIHGVGLFAFTALPEGYLLDIGDRLISYTREQLLSTHFPQQKLEEFGELLWYDPTRKLYCENPGSLLQYINHADPPGNNIGYKPDRDGKLTLTSLREIQPGEELLQDYHEFFPWDKDVAALVANTNSAKTFDKFLDEIAWTANAR